MSPDVARAVVVAAALVLVDEDVDLDADVGDTAVFGLDADVEVGDGDAVIDLDAAVDAVLDLEATVVVDAVFDDHVEGNVAGASTVTADAAVDLDAGDSDSVFGDHVAGNVAGASDSDAAGADAALLDADAVLDDHVEGNVAGACAASLDLDAVGDAGAATAGRGIELVRPLGGGAAIDAARASDELAAPATGSAIGAAGRGTTGDGRGDFDAEAFALRALKGDAACGVTRVSDGPTGGSTTGTPPALETEAGAA